MKGIFPIDKFRTLQTPFYYYDTKVLRDTLSAINQEVAKYPNYSVHYAVKANANPKVLTIIRESGMGADCVSGGEIRAAIRAGFPADKVVFAGVGKADWEINLGLEYGIFCFNVESIPELEVINELAAAQNKIANVAFRINPDVGAHTHANITTGLAENKFGISMQDMDKVIDVAQEMKNVKFIGLHFHIGSQILDDLKKYGTVTVDKEMCIICVVGDLEWENVGFEAKALDAMRNIPVRMISFGGSNYNISFLIRECDKKVALQSLSDMLFNDK